MMRKILKTRKMWGIVISKNKTVFLIFASFSSNRYPLLKRILIRKLQISTLETNSDTQVNAIIC